MSLNYKEKKLENSLIEKFSIKIKIFLLGRDSTPAVQLMASCEII